MSDPVVIPLSAVASQTVLVPLSSQSIQLDIAQLATGLFMNITLNGTLVMAGVLCQDRTWIVRKSYFGLPGDLVFVDTMGTDDPDYSGLGKRYLLYYQEGQNV
ncbi:phage baseplate plug family protein [Gluconobacter sphaericus]|uniref:Cyanophage baseplate Pam3 plug gp18 domain-containing protein n=1 Tax=Gluconobacter sphaericus NBRC 12467 TaxID=1307951 RepID=A0AA37SK27_9PROT|nr:hypothetical protein [Gluconobacter sphaericus]MBF0885548.1 hypothetical protein [Gluconobacter sphaericus]GBR56518.1 hypothetical protein AA12467_2652 [Gluconobacter sphaericus NBRC 12467]GEB42786.1 hypothetical protein GSP01_15680 [Gluconobacter sphaericus NBRC 12467]GLQ84762.1 hypothetical protein GCM10007872_16700 [Gluconobacter sphaericus NBRC 12467]GLQ85083.1 hypothetical protein GCM10007872_19910 [Gluconobacter sphaericus NBRC 12467]